MSAPAVPPLAAEPAVPLRPPLAAEPAVSPPPATDEPASPWVLPALAAPPDPGWVNCVLPALPPQAVSKHRPRQSGPFSIPPTYAAPRAFATRAPARVGASCGSE